MRHQLLPPVTDDSFGTKAPLVKYACKCGGWRRICTGDNMPRFSTIESGFEEHRQRAGAEDLRNGVGPALTKAQESLEDVLRSMHAIAEASVKAFEAMEEFIDAHQEAQTKGIGVVVVRHGDGGTSSTPNVFVPAGTAIFMDEPAPAQPPAFQLGIDPASPPVAILYPVEEAVA